MKITKLGQLSNGQKTWGACDDYGSWVFFEDCDGDFDEASGQSVPKDQLDYRYTHGGRLYREACDLWWKKTDSCR